MTSGPFLVDNRLAVLRYNPDGLKMRLLLKEAPLPAFSTLSCEVFVRTYLERISARAAVDVATAHRFALHRVSGHPARPNDVDLECAPICSTEAETRRILWRHAAPQLETRALHQQVAYPNTYYSHGLHVVLCVLAADGKLSVVKSPPFDTFHPGTLHPGWVLPMTRADFHSPGGLTELARWWAQTFLRVTPLESQVKALAVCCDLADYSWFVPVVIDLRFTEFKSNRLMGMTSAMDAGYRLDFMEFKEESLEAICQRFAADKAPYMVSACKLVLWGVKGKYPKLAVPDDTSRGSDG